MRADAVAWLAVVLVVACGTAPDDENRVRITVYHARALAPGATVWFTDPATDEILAQGKTSSDGEFSASVPAGASVTAAVEEPDPDAPAWTLHTILDVEPGDDLWVGDRRTTGASVVGTLSVRLPGAWPGTDYYSVSVGCTTIEVTDVQSRVAVPLTGDCVTASGNAVVRATSIDRTVTRPLAFTPVTAVAAPPSGETVEVDLEAWQSDDGEIAITLANIAEVPDGGSVEALVSYDGMLFDRWEAQVDPAAVVLVPYSPGADLQLSWRGSILYGSLDADAQVQSLIRSAPPPLPSSAEVDFADALPRLGVPTGSIGQTGSPEVSWADGGEAADADGLIVRAKWINPNRTSVRWTLLAPVTLGAPARFPSVPDSLASLRGAPAFPIDTSITSLDIEPAAGYEELRLGGALDHLYQSPLTAGPDRRASTSGASF